MPRVSEEELVYLPRGWWHCSRVRRGRQQRPVPVKAGRAPAPPSAYCEAFATLLDPRTGTATEPADDREATDREATA